MGTRNAPGEALSAGRLLGFMTCTYNDRVALVTGAGRGIGRAIAALFGKYGITVICVSRSEISCGEAAESINSSGGKATAYPVDVSDGAAVDSAARDILAQFGRVDILVNNAGITRDGLILRMPDESWREVLDTNLSSCFFWSKHLAHPMARNRWGRIVNITSVSGLSGNAGQVNYASAKAGMVGLTKSLAKELASRKITVNAVAPGFIETDMTADLDQKTRESVLKLIPLRRFGKAEEIAHMVLFLGSEEAGFITGQVFTIDGGMVM